MNFRKESFIWYAFSVIISLLMAASLLLGSVSISLTDLWNSIIGNDVSPVTYHILLNFRLPKTLTALIAGSALAASGLLMQTMFRNPLAGPFVLGISSGASLGVAISTLWGVTLVVGSQFNLILSGWGRVIAALSGATAVLIVVMQLNRKLRNDMLLLIIGLLLSHITNGLISILIYFSNPDQIQTYLLWTMGSFRGVQWRELVIMGPLVFAGIVLAVWLVKPLNALLLGEHYAASMGIPVSKIQALIIAATAVMSGTVTAFCGPVGFIGIMAPHLARGLFGTSDHRLILPASLAMGSCLALMAELIAQLPGFHETLPLNSVLSLLGAPMVVFILMRRKRYSGA
ncbi:MAG: iron ABC transporter permease [SAR324 cluster bacterium]|nr:iron ABC transporter permease [SAR324 cluster bacterium]